MTAQPIPAKLRAQVLERDDYCCARCGISIRYGYYSLHHRLPRGRGGKHTAENLVTLCGSGTSAGGCHAHVESHRRAATAGGWLLHTGADPATSPVRSHGEWMQPTATGWRPVEHAEPHQQQGRAS